MWERGWADEGAAMVSIPVSGIEFASSALESGAPRLDGKKEHIRDMSMNISLPSHDTSLEEKVMTISRRTCYADSP